MFNTIKTMPYYKIFIISILLILALVLFFVIVSHAIPLTITKQVRNVTAGTGFAANATGKPGDILEYSILIRNPLPGKAIVVYVSDPLDANTTFVAGSLTWVAASSTPGTKAVQSTATVLPVLRVNAGTGATATAGGALRRNQFVTFTYRVTIN